MKKLTILFTAAALLSMAACTQQQPAKPMTNNAPVCIKAHALFSDNKFDDVVNLAAENIRVTNVATGEVFNGKTEFRKFLMGFKTAFPDLKIVEKNSFESGEQVLLEFDGIATHTGPLVGPAGTIPATGKPVKLAVCEVMRVVDGKIASITNYQDSGSLMAQLGMMGAK